MPTGRASRYRSRVRAEDAIAGSLAARRSPAARGRIGSVFGGWVVVAGSVAMLVLLATHHLSTKSFWYDEAFSLRIARLAPAELFATLAGREANGALYYVVLSAWRLLGRVHGRDDPAAVTRRAPARWVDGRGARGRPVRDQSLRRPGVGVQLIERTS